MRIFTELDSSWQVDVSRNHFKPPVVAGQDYQRLIFNENFRDGEVQATITIRPTAIPAGEERHEASFDSKVGAVIFRFRDPDNYYYAGLGGYGNKFFIARMLDNGGKAIAARGDRTSVDFDTAYDLKIRCSGNRIALLHNNISVLEVFDNGIEADQWGLQTWRTDADFRNVAGSATQPKCFVIMPFAPEFDLIYNVIHDTVTARGYDCIRADKRYLIGSITDDINEQIKQANLLVADLTGRNPNVFYEVGYAAALRKPVIQIAQSVDNLPFDVSHLRTFSYGTHILADRKLADDLNNATQSLV